MKNLLIAVDGPSGAGKGALSKTLAKDYDLVFLDTGLLYRAVGLLAFEAGVFLKEEEGKPPLKAVLQVAKTLNLEMLRRRESELRQEVVGSYASKIAVVPEVRVAVTQFIHEFVNRNQERGAVLDGRDMGTVVVPQADLKFYVTASAEIRAQRRFKELRLCGKNVTHDEILAQMKLRDDRDSSRQDSPLKPASDAVFLDTSGLSLDEVVACAKTHIDKFLQGRALD